MSISFVTHKKYIMPTTNMIPRVKESNRPSDMIDDC